MIEHEKQRIAIDAAEWAYDKINVSAYSGYIAGATSEHSRITELLKEAHETIGDLLLKINKKNDLISEAHNSMLSLLKVCQSPTLTTHGLANVDKAIVVVNQLRRELESLKVNNSSYG